MDRASADIVGTQELLRRHHNEAEPTTDYQSKMVVLRAERHDRIAIPDVVTRLRNDGDVPSEATVVRRTSPYFGPKLTLSSNEERYLLTAPGPDTQLLLWKANYLHENEQHGWKKLAEVKAQFLDDQPQYDLCADCGEPVQTLEHQRKSLVGRCPGPEV